MEKKYKDMCFPEMGTRIIEKISNTEYLILLENWGIYDKPKYGFAVRKEKPTRYGPGYILTKDLKKIKVWRTYKEVKEWIKENKRFL